jgi:hypothetical protein
VPKLNPRSERGREEDGGTFGTCKYETTGGSKLKSSNAVPATCPIVNMTSLFILPPGFAIAENLCVIWHKADVYDVHVDVSQIEVPILNEGVPSIL